MTQNNFEKNKNMFRRTPENSFTDYDDQVLGAKVIPWCWTKCTTC